MGSILSGLLWGFGAAFTLVFFLYFAFFVGITISLIFTNSPPKQSSWWYPDPDRWDYGFKLLAYAIIDANVPRQPEARLFVRIIATLLLVAILTFAFAFTVGV